MINRTHVWFAAFVVILFAAGMASGVALDRAMGWGHRPGSGFRGGPGTPGGPANTAMGASGRGMGGGGRGSQGGPPTEAFVNELEQELSLTTDQKTRITAIIDASRPRLRTLQDEASKRITDEQEAVTAEIAKLLNPDQAKKLAELQKKPRGGPFGFRGRGGRGR